MKRNEMPTQEAQAFDTNWTQDPRVNEQITITGLSTKRPSTGKVLGCVKGVGYTLKYLDKTEDKNIILLQEEISVDLEGLPDAAKDMILSLVEKDEVEIIAVEKHIDYTHMDITTILRKLLPDLEEITTRFEKVGHLAHINLRGDQLLHKYLIGDVILKKSKDIRTVVNKTEKVSNKFRVLPMELIAGDDDTQIELAENGCTFKFDYSQVFWNSRLENEHKRLIQLCKPGDIVCDMFAGVGPFAVPLARKGIKVYANDLNTYSYEAMKNNAELNLVYNVVYGINFRERKRGNIEIFNMDARDFARHLVSNVLSDENGYHTPITQVFMNLPKTSHLFLDAFIELFPEGAPLPMIHCYTFARSDTILEDYSHIAIEQIENVLGTNIKPTNTFKVRQTATSTVEYCVSFPMPEAVAYKKNL